MTTTEIKGTSPMIELDAQEFGLHLKQGGWRLGLLVARDVEPDEGDGVYREARSTDRPSKVSATWFADRAGTTHGRVLRYYRAWERYAAKGHVPPASELSPGDEPDLRWDMLPRWTLSDIASHGATGPLNLRIKLGHYTDRLIKSNTRLITFFEKDVPESKEKLGKQTKALAESCAECLETEARLLRQFAAGEPVPSKDELKDMLDPDKFFGAF